jgi:hypothetical protein
MDTKLILEDGIVLSKYKKSKLLSDYNDKGLVSLPDGVIVKAIQAMADGETNKTTSIIILGKLQ